MCCGRLYRAALNLCTYILLMCPAGYVSYNFYPSGARLAQRSVLDKFEVIDACSYCDLYSEIRHGRSGAGQRTIPRPYYTAPDSVRTTYESSGSGQT